MRKAAANGKSKHAAEQAPWPHHESIHIRNFTVFRDVEFKFNPQLNVIIGENGSGKTHLLKLMYAIQRSSRVDYDDVLLFPLLDQMFSQSRDRLVSSGDNPIIEIEGRWGSKDYSFRIDTRNVAASFGDASHKGMSLPVLIPSVDMLAHTWRFQSTWDKYNIDFDMSYRDIVGNLLSPPLRTTTEKRDQLAIKVRDLIGAEVTERDERFYFENEHGQFPAPVVAEGHRKLGTLYTLLRNGLVEPGNTLYWDEPEANLSPRLLEGAVKVLLEIASSGVQTFVTTHSYELLKEIDLQTRKGDATYFALSLEEGYSAVHPAPLYEALSPNKIAEEFDSLYDRQIEKAIRGGR